MLSFPSKSKGRSTVKQVDWEDIKDITSGTVSRTTLDDTLPGGPVERTITYMAPWARCDRVEDYRVAWEFFEQKASDLSTSSPQCTVSLAELVLE